MAKEAGDHGLRVEEIQEALREENLDGWLFFDHHERDPLAYRVLQFHPEQKPTRRWYYFIPSHGEPQALVHRIESRMLDALPGRKVRYASWSEQAEALGRMLTGCRTVAMQYSPECAVPYVAMVDAGTVDLVRSYGPEVVSSADLIQIFEARWNREKLESHLEAGRRVDAVRRAAFELLGERLRSLQRIGEWEVKRFILDRFAEAGLYTDHGPIVAANAHSADPHYEPTEESSTLIRAGDWVLIDLWAKLQAPGSVYYDVTWTGYCGNSVPEEMARVFGIVTEARDRAVARVSEAFEERVPLAGFEVDDAARQYIREQGYGAYFFHRTGHSIGEEVHGAGANMDNLETHDTRRVIPWTCFSVEPGVYLRDFGVRSEVDVFVDEDRARVTGEIQESPVLICP
ncbi:MAG: M24 family metallopeptidase [Bryobacteraceae bacterium]